MRQGRPQHVNNQHFRPVAAAGGTGRKERLPCRRGLANFWAWLAADFHGGGIFFAAAGGLAHLRAWLAADGHGGDVYFFFAAGGLAHLKAWLAADSHGNDGGCNGEYRVGRGG